MKSWKILPHKADVKLKIFGRTKKELFLRSLGAMSEVMMPEKANAPALERVVKIISPDLAALLVDFLGRALYLAQTNKEIYLDLDFQEFSDTKIAAKLKGRKVERFGEDIKAVTYHSADVRRLKDRTWQATILFDV